ncbi:fam-b protein [Plasmodium chabaudi chabaudi]|uniref:Fam-b protein n=1 Tax=Plasmodium chabaudi chabaudi TaxID=31271 RepID=A0A077TG99_PLACU|nr:fam-b protein [Plasmodium chabaudi chabaudi]SCM19291.1 fam-b protein [Plasmodium chabaudi chabaudi]VTZ66313.1 fam-b protein [Plasmodium chabaudi chabaudi]|eukprot:XP_016653030.1 fam-b protein [Plasmodium chabaudi chabaudi]
MGPFHILKKILIFPVIICSLECSKNVLYDVKRGQNVYSQAGSINFRNNRILEGSRNKFDINYFYDSVVSIVDLKDGDEECGETQPSKWNKNKKTVCDNTEEYKDKMNLKGSTKLKKDLDCAYVMGCDCESSSIIDDEKVSVVEDILEELESAYDEYNNKKCKPTLPLCPDDSLVNSIASSKCEHSKHEETGGGHMLDIDFKKYEEEYNKFNVQEYKKKGLTEEKLKQKFMDMALNIVIGILVIGTIGPAFPFMYTRKEKIGTPVKKIWNFYENIFKRKRQNK